MLLDRFQAYLKEHPLCTKEDKILLTVSGGVDSMVMLSLFVRSGYNVAVAHCNFQLRGQEAEEDEVLVEQVSASLGVPCYNRRFETQAEVDRSGESVQMVARRLRYGWFDELAAEHNYNRIAIAHHADDSVETFFINLFRGTGVRGLTGIHSVRGDLIRPLLFATRKDIVEYAISQKIPYREDSSNGSTKYLRNKIRLGIVPRIKEASSNFSEVMSDNVYRLTQAQRFIDVQIDQIRRQVVTRLADGLVIDLQGLSAQLPLRFVLFELLRGYGFHGEVIDRICRAMEREGHTGKRFYAKDQVAYLDRHRILLEPIAPHDECLLEASEKTKTRYVGGTLIHFEHLDIDDVDTLHLREQVALLDESKLCYPLTLRRWREGDSFIPLGMDGHKKVSDFLIDAKVSMPDKQRQFVLLSGEDIVWLVGRRIDDRYRLTSKTENVLRLTPEVAM